jgi:hypothetical protein
MVTTVRPGEEDRVVDEDSARAIADGVARGELRKEVERQSSERPDLRLSLENYEVSVDEERDGGCRIYAFFYRYTNPPGHELGVGHPGHFTVRVHEQRGRADLLPGH